MFDLIVINPSFPRALRESVAQTIDFLIRNTYFVSSGYFQGYLWRLSQKELSSRRRQFLFVIHNFRFVREIVKFEAQEGPSKDRSSFFNPSLLLCLKKKLLLRQFSYFIKVTYLGAQLISMHRSVCLQLYSAAQSLDLAIYLYTSFWSWIFSSFGG